MQLSPCVTRLPVISPSNQVKKPLSNTKSFNLFPAGKYTSQRIETSENLPTHKKQRSELKSFEYHSPDQPPVTQTPKSIHLGRKMSFSSQFPHGLLKNDSNLRITSPTTNAATIALAGRVRPSKNTTPRCLLKDLCSELNLETQPVQSINGAKEKESQQDREHLQHSCDNFVAANPVDCVSKHASGKLGSLLTPQFRRPVRRRTTLFTSSKNSTCSISSISSSKLSVANDRTADEGTKSTIPSLGEIYKERVATNFNNFFKRKRSVASVAEDFQQGSLLRSIEIPKDKAANNCLPIDIFETSIVVEGFKTPESQSQCVSHRDLSQSQSITQLSSGAKMKKNRRLFHSKTLCSVTLEQKLGLSKQNSIVMTDPTPSKNEGVLTLNSQNQTNSSSTCTEENTTMKKSPKKSSPIKRLWNKENDRVLEEIQSKTLEKIPGMSFVSPGPSQNALASLPTEFCLTFSVKEESHQVIPKARKRDYKVVRKALVDAIKYFQLLKLDPKEISKKKIFSSQPYEKDHAREFILAAKTGELITVELLLIQNKYLVYDFDNVHQTALHWAAKRGYTEIADVLIKNGADLNVQDLLGRTPLYFAIQNNHIEILKMLLKAQCNPWSTDKVNYTEMVSRKPLAKYYLSKCRQPFSIKIHITMAMTPLKNRKAVWMSQSLVLALDPKINLPLVDHD